MAIYYGNTEIKPELFTDKEYTELEYLESTGTQYIDTGYVPEGGSFTFYLNIMPKQQKTAFGVVHQNNNGDGMWVGATSDLVFNGNFNTRSSYTFGVDTKYSIQCNYNGMWVNGSQVRETGGSWNSSGNFWLFGHNDIAGVEPAITAQRVYSFIAVNGVTGETYRNMIPVRRNSDKVLGMLDTAHNIFYTNTGTGTFIAGPETKGVKVYVGNDQVYPKKPLCFTSIGTSTIQLKITGTLTNAVDIYYSYDNSTWTSWLSGTSGESSTITLTDGQKLYVWNKNSTLSESGLKYVKFVMTGSLAASGNCNSMINYGELSNYCYNRMFSDCTSLTQAPELPATELAEYCYSSMFYRCSSLTQAPELPATELAEECYSYMFSGCTSLTTAPALPATTVGKYSYFQMFYGCSNLVSAPDLPATTLAESCYSYMFSDCSSLTQAPELPATTLAESCYSYMFRHCSSLKVNENGEGTAFFTCPDITGLSNPTFSMFYGTGGTFTGTPTTGNTYKYY